MNVLGLIKIYKIHFGQNIFYNNYEITFAKKTSNFKKVCQGKLLECLLKKA